MRQYISASEGTLPTHGRTDAPTLNPTTLIEDWRPDHYTLNVGGAIVRDGPNPFGWLPYVIFANAPRPQEFWGERLWPIYSTSGAAAPAVVSRILESRVT
ncbi:MAG: hypothetical protein U0841_12095 [Chloroflexia bacterium]